MLFGFWGDDDFDMSISFHNVKIDPNTVRNSIYCRNIYMYYYRSYCWIFLSPSLCMCTHFFYIHCFIRHGFDLNRRMFVKPMSAFICRLKMRPRKVNRYVNWINEERVPIKTQNRHTYYIEDETTTEPGLERRKMVRREKEMRRNVISRIVHCTIKSDKINEYFSRCICSVLVHAISI